MGYRINQQQIRNFEDTHKGYYIARLIARYKDVYPYFNNNMDEAKITQLLATTIDQLEKEGFNEQGPVAFYLDLIILLGRGFKTDPQYKWLNKILKNNLHLNQVDRATLLYQQVSDYLTTIYGENNQHFIAAYRRLEQIDFATLVMPRNNYLENAYQLLNKIYPEKCQQIEKHALITLIKQATIKAYHKYHFEAANEAILVVLLMFLKGHQFDTDPFNVNLKKISDIIQQTKGQLLQTRNKLLMDAFVNYLKESIKDLNGFINSYQYLTPPIASQNSDKKIKKGSFAFSENSLIVQFRPHWQYDGEFGFDWLRTDDIVKDKTEQPYITMHQVPNEPPHKECLVSNIKAQNTWSRDELIHTVSSKDEAYQELKALYQSFPIERKGYADAYNDGEYFVPYLNLFSKATSELISAEYEQQQAIPLSVKPPYQATLRMFANAIGARPAKVVIEFNKEYFTIEQLPIIASSEDETKQQALLPDGIWFNPENPQGRNKEITPNIVITCLKDFPIDQYIEVYGYYQPDLSQRKLAGRICVCANDKSHRKVLPIVSVMVKTDASKDPEHQQIKVGELATSEINLLYKYLYQSLSYPYLVIRPNNKPIELELLADDHFLLTNLNENLQTITPAESFINRNGQLCSQLQRRTQNVTETNNYLHDYLKEKFDLQTAEQYKHFFNIFIFGISSMADSYGMIKKVAESNLIITEGKNTKKVRSTNSPHSLVFELYRCLGLNPIYISNKNYNFNAPQSQFFYYGANETKDADCLPEYKEDIKATDNLMANKKESKTTYYWQWQIVREMIDNIKSTI